MNKDRDLLNITTNDQATAREQARSLERQAEYTRDTSKALLGSLEHLKNQSMAMLDLIKSLQSLTNEQKNQNEILQNEITIKRIHEHREKILFWVAIGINLALAISSICVLIFR